MITGVIASSEVAYKQFLGSAGNATSGTTLTLALAQAIAVNDLVVVRWCSDNLSATTPTATFSDGSNTYTVAAQTAVNATAGSGVAAGMLLCRATAARVAGTTVTLTLSGAVTAKAMYLESFVGYTTTVRSATATATGATSAAAVTSGTVNAGDLVVAMIGAESRALPTFDGDNTNGNWSTGITVPNATTGTDNLCCEANGQYKIPTASGAQTYNNAVANQEWVGVIAVLTPG